MNTVRQSSTPVIIPVILCGGAGTRLWPLSQSEKPKQLLPIVNKTILLHDTLMRIQDCVDAPLSNIITVTTKKLVKETTLQLKNFDEHCAQHVLSEPSSKNTAAAIAYASLYAQNMFGENALLWILPADHYVENHVELRDILKLSSQNLPSNGILTFGITPTKPETGYGYIETNATPNVKNDIQKIKSFTEKPDEKVAEQYIATGRYFWNSGMFLASVKTLINEYIEHYPQILSELHHAMTADKSLEEAYNNTPKTPFDKAIMEHTDNAYVYPCDIGWSDVGSWQNIWDIKSKDLQGNVLRGDIHTQETQNCLIHSNKLTIAAIGLQDIAIIENGNSILIADKKNISALQKLSNSLASKDEFNAELTILTKLWGLEKIILQNADCTIKELILQPGKKTNYIQRMDGSTHWSITAGSAVAIINGEENKLNQQDSILIPEKTPYRLKNKSDQIVRVIEIQYGDHDSDRNTIITDENMESIDLAS
jgi:mannose-1-phosphate guanylyltransferase/mannose-6-phosphate isomerase